MNYLSYCRFIRFIKKINLVFVCCEYFYTWITPRLNFSVIGE